MCNYGINNFMKSCREKWVCGCVAVLLALSTALLGGCAVTSVPNSSAVNPREVDPSVKGTVSGVGIESQDVIAMTDKMMRDMLADPGLVNRPKAPRVIVDGEYFVNDSLQAINKNTIIDRLRINLNRASKGKLIFVGRNYAKMIEQERDLKRSGVTDIGTTGLTKAQAGADFRLGGRISSLDTRDPKTGLSQRYNQITFEMVDLENGVIVWSGIYEFAKSSADDIIYR